jgi:aspartyl/asparaginyl beta-hydroxylase (cupin superfamily)
VSTIIKYLQLQQQFDAYKMQQEVAALEHNWTAHYNKAHYEGVWTVLPLRSINGSTENIVSVHTVQENVFYQNTPLLQACPYTKQVLDFFQCEKTAVRLMKLNAGAVIKEHSDQEMSFEQGEVRFHIPVITHPNVAFYLQGEQVAMKEGECWYLNLSLQHSVRNNSTINRIHLVIDCKVNEWVKELFALTPAMVKRIDADAIKKRNKKDQVKIIYQLRLMNTPTAIELADKIEKEL